MRGWHAVGWRTPTSVPQQCNFWPTFKISIRPSGGSCEYIYTCLLICCCVNEKCTHNRAREIRFSSPNGSAHTMVFILFFIDVSVFLHSNTAMVSNNEQQFNNFINSSSRAIVVLLSTLTQKKTNQKKTKRNSFYMEGPEIFIKKIFVCSMLQKKVPPFEAYGHDDDDDIFVICAVAQSGSRKQSHNRW